MDSRPELPQRKAIRLRGYDYSRAGAYFVTICAEGKRCIFGAVMDDRVELNPAGEVVRETWFALPERFPRLVLDAFVIMPNHLHGILGFVGAGLAPPVADGEAYFTAARIRGTSSSLAKMEKYSIADVIGVFKSISTIKVNGLLRRKDAHLWQRNYYEHIVRQGEDLREIQRYIMENPLKWMSDRENPSYMPG